MEKPNNKWEYELVVDDNGEISTICMESPLHPTEFFCTPSSNNSWDCGSAIRLSLNCHLVDRSAARNLTVKWYHLEKKAKVHRSI